jgi:hypothetical protein
MRLALIVAATLAAAPLPAAAQSPDAIGVTAAVRPDTRGNRQNSTGQSLLIGNAVFHEETIRTNARGRAQLRFLDESMGTVWPSSEFILYRYVYNRATRTGQLQASVGSGVVQMRGGALAAVPGGVQIAVGNSRVEPGQDAVVQISRGPDGDRVLGLAGQSNIVPGDVNGNPQPPQLLRNGFEAKFGPNGRVDISRIDPASPDLLNQLFAAPGSGDRADPITRQALRAQLSSIPFRGSEKLTTFSLTRPLVLNDLDVLSGYRTATIGDLRQQTTISLLPRTPPAATPPTPPTPPAAPVRGGSPVTPPAAPVAPAAPAFPVRTAPPVSPAPPSLPPVPPTRPTPPVAPVFAPLVGAPLLSQ